MGQYNKAVLTTAGENLIARALAGEIELNITKAITSDFAYPDNADLKRLKDMQGVRQTVCNPETIVVNKTIIQTRVLFSNEEIISTYFIHNIGLYATDGADEVLFCMVTAETPDEMPRYNGVASTSFIYNIQNVVEDVSELNIIVNPAGVATIQDVMERVNANGGNISETKIETLDAFKEKFPVPAAGESVKRFFGKALEFLKNIRPLLGDSALYVSVSTGSDITGDGTQENPFKTIQHAIDVTPYDLGGYAMTIYVANGPYPEDITLKGFYNGCIIVTSLNPNTISTDVNINRILVVYCNALVSIKGISVTDSTSQYAIGVINSNQIYLHYLNVVEVATDKTGIYCGNNNSVRIYFCKVSNKNKAFDIIDTCGYIVGCSGSGNYISAIAGWFSTIHLSGNTISANIVKKQYTGGQFIEENGTQISNIISSGLSCTWGTISGGYVRHGNQKGTAIVTVQMNIGITTPLSPGIDYTIKGFPIPSVVGMSVSVSAQSYCSNCYMGIGTSGEIHFWVTNPIGAGVGLAFSVTYLTNS